MTAGAAAAATAAPSKSSVQMAAAAATAAAASSESTLQQHRPVKKIWELQMERQLAMLREGDLGSLGFSFLGQHKEQH